MLGLDQAALAELALVHRNTIMGFEAGRKVPNRNNLLAIQAALEAAGVTFTNGDEPGVRMRSLKLKDAGENAYHLDDVSKLFAFAATDGERRITICVEDLALERLERDVVGGTGYLRALAKHRDRIFRIAAQKYELEQNDTISIAYSDVAPGRDR